MFELPEPFEQGKEAEVNRAQVERGDFRLERGGGPQALLDRHRRGAAGGDVDHAIRALLDQLQERRESLWRLIGAPVGGIARVQMHDRRARLGCADGGFGEAALARSLKLTKPSPAPNHRRHLQDRLVHGAPYPRVHASRRSYHNGLDDR